MPVLKGGQETVCFLRTRLKRLCAHDRKNYRIFCGLRKKSADMYP
jgi:hypothetical protein